MRSTSNFTAYALILTGTYFLLSKLGWIPHLGPLFSEWWPVILIVIGVAMLVRRSFRGNS